MFIVLMYVYNIEGDGEEQIHCYAGYMTLYKPACRDIDRGCHTTILLSYSELWYFVDIIAVEYFVDQKSRL